MVKGGENKGRESRFMDLRVAIEVRRCRGTIGSRRDHSARNDASAHTNRSPSPSASGRYVSLGSLSWSTTYSQTHMSRIQGRVDVQVADHVTRQRQRGWFSFDQPAPAKPLISTIRTANQLLCIVPETHVFLVLFFRTCASAIIW